MGRALWMVSVSVNGWPRAKWPEDVERVAMRLVSRVLDGVGVPGDDRIEQGGMTVLVRRECSQVERSRLREPYLIKP
jgi:hypothetical protein